MTRPTMSYYRWHVIEIVVTLLLDASLSLSPLSPTLSFCFRVFCSMITHSVSVFVSQSSNVAIF